MNLIYPFQPPAILNKEVDALIVNKINKQCDELLLNKEELEAKSQLLDTFPHGDAVNIYNPIEELQKEIIDASDYYIKSFEHVTEHQVIPKGSRLNIKSIWFLDLKDNINKLNPKGGIIYVGNSEILKEICPGDFGKIDRLGYCMIGSKY